MPRLTMAQKLLMPLVQMPFPSEYAVLQADEFLVVGSVKDVVTAELVRHDRGVVLADVLQNPEQLLA